jgi:hypothetical protein
MQKGFGLHEPDGIPSCLSIQLSCHNRLTKSIGRFIIRSAITSVPVGQPIVGLAAPAILCEDEHIDALSRENPSIIIGRLLYSISGLAEGTWSDPGAFLVFVPQSVVVPSSPA